MKRFMASMYTPKHSAFSGWVGSVPPSLDVHDSASVWKFYYNRSSNQEVEDRFSAKFYSFEDILGAADFLCILLPLTKETDKMIGAREFSKMKQGAIFINGSRGRIVDQSALIQSLQIGHLGAAGLDVFEKEPLPADSPLLKMANVVALPHVGSATHETRLNMVRCAVENLIDVLNSGSSQHAVNPQALEHRVPAQS
jgi:glyoxylate/hydroxypyruvate/2-ketogluconate reductase